VLKGNHTMNRARLSFEAYMKTSSNEFAGAAYRQESWEILAVASVRFIGNSSLRVLLGDP